MGFQTWGLVTLRTVQQAGHDIVLVVTHPEPTDLYAQHFNESVAEYARAQALPLAVATTVTPEIAYQLKGVQPDILISSNWRRRLSPAVLRSARLGGINVHRSLLPHYAGVAPINWAIANGEVETGVTIHLMTEAFDLGDIVVQERVPIGHTETATDVFHKTTPVIQRLLPEALAQLDSGTARLMKQDPRLAEFFHPRGERELRINWAKSAAEIYNLIRAQSDPFANAFTVFEGHKLKVKTASLPEHRYRGTPGRLCERVPPDGVLVLCGAGSEPSGQGLILHTLQAEGQAPCKATEFFHRLGVYLGDPL
jgi:methionyl-tRNA formyltransferase